jgi:hypothetical protein
MGETPKFLETAQTKMVVASLGLVQNLLYSSLAIAEEEKNSGKKIKTIFLYI